MKVVEATYKNTEVGEWVVCDFERASKGGNQYITFPMYDFYQGKAYEIKEVDRTGVTFNSEDGRLGTSLNGFLKVLDSPRTIDKENIREHFKDSEFKEIYLSDKHAIYRVEEKDELGTNYYVVEVNPLQWIYNEGYNYVFISEDVIKVKTLDELKSVLKNGTSYKLK